jgi:hypothetical protein
MGHISGLCISCEVKDILIIRLNGPNSIPVIQ